MVFAFLPFHTSPVFRTMLSIITERTSPTLRFLHPYIQSLANPPRHVIVHTAFINRPFFTAISAYVLKSCHLGLQHPALISFWASVATEAVAAMFDQSRSARLEARKQDQEDIVLLLVPILNDGLSVDNVPDLRVGCYMILMILASKASLAEDVLTIMMEAITSGWYQTPHAGLICLGVLAEQKRTVGLSEKVFEAVIALEHLDDDLTTISKHYELDKLVLGVALGIVSGFDTARDVSGLRLLRVLMEANVMSDTSVKAVIKLVLSKIPATTPELNPRFYVQGSLADLVLRLCDSKDVAAVLHSCVKDSNFDLVFLESRIRQVDRSKNIPLELPIEGVDMKDADQQTTRGDFEALISRIPIRTAFELSFLSHSDSYVFGSLARAFLSIYRSSINVEKFSDLPVLRKSLGMTEPLFFSFFVRVWCGHGPAEARTAAILAVINYLKKETLTADVQVLLPYIVHALADTSTNVRRSAANLLLVLAPAYRKMADKGKKDESRPILGQQQIYGQDGETQAVTWLSNKEAARIILDLMVPGLEECMLDGSHVSQLLSDHLNSPKHSRGANAAQKELKKSLRLAFFSNICSHVVNTPLYAVKCRLLGMLERVTKVGSISRTKLLLPLLSSIIKQGQHEYERICEEEKLDASQLLERIAGIIVPNDREGIQTLKGIIERPDNLNFRSLRAAALHRLQIIWTSMKIDFQVMLAKALFEAAVGNVEAGTDGNQKAEAMETLRTLPLPTAILQPFLENLPSVSSSLQNKSPVSKRRRTSHSYMNGNGPSNERDVAFAIRQNTFVLELVGDAKTEQHPELLGGLFRILCDLQRFQGQAVAAVGYLQILAMEGMLPIVRRANVRIR